MRSLEYGKDVLKYPLRPRHSQVKDVDYLLNTGIKKGREMIFPLPTSYFY
jgi:hypothetical protein